MRKKPLVVFDVETTGVKPATDRIISLSAVWRDGDDVYVANFLVNPGCKIPKEASDVHGITDEMVKDAPLFADVAKDIWEVFKGADVGGYNSNRFDIPILAEELARCGIDFDEPGRKCYDAFVVFRKMHPRDLAAAYREYCGKILEGAHDASVDATATFEIIEAQMLMHDEVADINDAHEFCEFGDRVDYAGHVIMKDGVPCFAFGKHINRPVLYDDETRGYAAWMISKDFPETTKTALKKILGWDKQEEMAF